PAAVKTWPRFARPPAPAPAAAAVNPRSNASSKKPWQKPAPKIAPKTKYPPEKRPKKPPSMFKKNYLVKINLPGGIVAAGDLYAIVEAAERARVEDMQFGARQQLFCKVADRYGEAFIKELEEAGIFYETEEECYPNIVSS